MATNEDMEISESGARMVEPLVHQEDGSNSGSRGQLWMVYFSTFVAVCGSFEFGSCIGYSSPAESAIREELDLSLAEAMRVSSAICIGGWLAVYYAKGAVSLDLGRLATGYGIGAFSYVVPVFVAEIAPRNLRGALTTLNQVLIVSGVSVIFVLGTVVSWRILALIGLVPCGIMILGLFLIPESPRWLAKKGYQTEFMEALQKLRGRDANITCEAEEIQDYMESIERLPKAKLFDLFQRRYLRFNVIGIGLMIFQQFGGINGVSFYVSSIFESAGFSSNLGTIIYACVQVIVTGLITPIMDTAGRKPLILISASGLVLGCILLGTSFFFKTHEVLVDAVPALALSGILVYIGSFSLGMGAVPWVMMSEIYPINVKGLAGSAATLVNWMGAWAISYTYNYISAWSSYGTFAIYAAVNAMAILFVILVVPETKGITLEQIQVAIGAER